MIYILWVYIYCGCSYGFSEIQEKLWLEKALIKITDEISTVIETTGECAARILASVRKGLEKILDEIASLAEMAEKSYLPSVLIVKEEWI